MLENLCRNLQEMDFKYPYNFCLEFDEFLGLMESIELHLHRIPWNPWNSIDSMESHGTQWHSAESMVVSSWNPLHSMTSMEFHVHYWIPANSKEFHGILCCTGLLV